MGLRFATRWPISNACLLALTGVLCAGWILQAQRSLGLEIPTGTNVLFGRVLDAGSGAPVADAVVTIIGFFDASGRAVSELPRTREVPEASQPRNVITNGNGYYVFRNLPAGRYAIAAMAFGYLGNSYPIHIVELNSGDKPVDVAVRLWKYAAISGTVVDERGEPVVGAPVTALRRAMLGGTPILRQSYGQAQTDDRGVYRLAELPPGSYVVGVLAAPTTVPASLAAQIDAVASDRTAAFELRGQLISAGALMVTTGEGVRIGDSVLQRPGPVLPPAPDGRMLGYATTFAPGTSNAADATVLTLGSGEERTAVHLSLRIAPTVRVSGVLTRPSGPVKNFSVQLFPPGAADLSDTEPAGVATAITDAAGAFTFLAITPGQYLVKTSLVPNWETSDPGEVPMWATHALTVGEADITGLAVAMKPGIRVSGRVEFKGWTGSAMPSSAYATVMLRPIGAGSWRPSRGRLAADGTFQTGGEPPGRYLVMFQGVAGWWLEGVSRGGRVIGDDVIELEAADVSGLVLTMSTKVSKVSGLVADAKGAADTAADVIVFPADTALWREGTFNDRRVRLVHTTSAAAFEVPHLAPGEYYIVAIRARPATEWQDPSFLDQLVAGATKFTLGEGAEHTVQLKTFTPRGR